MTTSANNTDSNKDSTPTPQTDSGYNEDTKPDEENKTDTDSSVDDYGYTKPESETEDDKKPEEIKPEEKKPEEDIKDPATGYGDDDKKPDEDKNKDDKDVKKDDEKSSEDAIKEALGELPEGYSKERLSQFALENKMTKEQVENYVKLAKEDVDQSKSDQEAQTLATRKQWKEELKNDSLFGGVGGDLFNKNVHTVEQTLDKYMPNMKKMLTDRGTMLPPYIMKDLLAISKVLNPTTKLVGGEAVEVKKAEGNFLDEMYK